MLHLTHPYNVIQARDGGLGEARSGTSMTPCFPLTRLFPYLILIVFFLTAGGSQVKDKEGLVLLLSFLPLSLSLVVQQQVWVVMATTVSHHDGADGAGIDVLNLEKAFYHIDVL